MTFKHVVLSGVLWSCRLWSWVWIWICCVSRSGAATASSRGRDRLCPRSGVCMDRRILGSAWRSLGVGERKMGSTTPGWCGLGPGPLGAAWRPLAFQPRALALKPSGAHVQ